MDLHRRKLPRTPLPALGTRVTLPSSPSSVLFSPTLAHDQTTLVCGKQLLSTLMEAEEPFCGSPYEPLPKINSQLGMLLDEKKEPCESTSKKKSKWSIVRSLLLSFAGNKPVSVRELNRRASSHFLNEGIMLHNDIEVYI